MDSIAEILTEEAAKEFPGISKLSNEDVNRIAEAVVEKAAEDVGVRDIMIGSVMGKGAIPLYGRETRQEPCACCLIDPAGPNAPENRMCTTKGAIGILSNPEERAWCSEIEIVSDGRCTRARAISEAARECKEKHPDDTEAFFKCFIPAFSQTTAKRSNPTGYVTITDPGKTTFKEGETISRGAFEKENERVKKLDEKPATGIETIVTSGRMIEIPLDRNGKAIPGEER